MSETVKESRIIITLSGTDKVGIVAEFTKVLADYKVNIEDIRQTIMQDQFVMFLMGDIENSEKSFHDIKQALLDKAKEMEMEIWVQRKQIFDNMHTL